jgi:hypothetical protein
MATDDAEHGTIERVLARDIVAGRLRSELS